MSTLNAKYIQNCYDGDPSEDNIRRIVTKAIRDTKRVSNEALSKVYYHATKSDFELSELQDAIENVEVTG